MRNYTRKLVAALMTAVLMVTVIFTGCAENKDPIGDQLRTDIVGIWMCEGGAQGVYNEAIDSYYYMFYEFTSDGKLVYHLLYPEADVYDDSRQYTIKDSYLTVDGAKCLVSIDGDKMVMTNNSGDSVYERITPEEALAVKLYYQEPSLYEVQQSIMLDNLDEENMNAEEESTTADSTTEPISASESSVETEASAEETVEESASETEASVTEEE